jgi:hypothetical protein
MQLPLTPLTVPIPLEEIYWRGPWDPKVDDYDPGNWRLVTHCGKSSTDFDNDILNNALKLTSVAPRDRPLVPAARMARLPDLSRALRRRHVMGNPAPSATRATPG